jgi:hypothetical protein
MADPVVPNYNKENSPGRLVTDRFDFQKHVNGEAFQHEAGIIVLNPAISVNGGPASSDLQEVITQINALVPQIVPDASGSTKGLVKLTLDLGGTAALPKVVGLQGFPITTSTPNMGDLLTWTGSFWTPQALTSFSTLTVSGNANINGILTTVGGYNLNSTGNAQVNSGAQLTVSATTNLTLSGQSTIITGGTGGVVINAGFSGLVINSFGGVVSNSGLSVLIGNVNIAKNITIGTDASNSMAVAATTQFSNGVTIGTSLSTNLLIKSTVGNSSQSTTFQGPLAFSNQGRILLKGSITQNNDQTVSVIPFKFIIAPSSLTGTHNYNLTATGALEGEWFHFYNESLYLQNLSGIISDAVAAGGERWFVMIGGSWFKAAKPT